VSPTQFHDFGLFTETPFYVPDQTILKKLARYWLLIHIFSGFSRRMWLRAIKYRTENVTLQQ
jgi:hypothetical protein